MSTLSFGRAAKTLTLHSSSGAVLGTWTSENNTDSRSQGPWPNGRYGFAHWNAHADDGPSSAYGSHGIAVFDVPDRTGMGVHSGRRDNPDGLGRRGPGHATMGCVRTVDEAMARLRQTHADPLTEIVVG